MKPLLVGEANPYGADPEYALYPLPERASGDRLCRLVMGLRRVEYLQRFDRVNLCPQRWSAPQSRDNAIDILRSQRLRIVLLGAKVCGAFGLAYEPFSAHASPLGGTRILERVPPDENVKVDLGPTRVVVILPHPSGLCRAWNEPGAFEKARKTLVWAGVL